MCASSLACAVLVSGGCEREAEAPAAASVGSEGPRAARGEPPDPIAALLAGVFEVEQVERTELDSDHGAGSLYHLRAIAEGSRRIAVERADGTLGAGCGLVVSAPESPRTVIADDTAPIAAVARGDRLRLFLRRLDGPDRSWVGSTEAVSVESLRAAPSEPRESDVRNMPERFRGVGPQLAPLRREDAVLSNLAPLVRFEARVPGEVVISHLGRESRVVVVPRGTPVTAIAECSALTGRRMPRIELRVGDQLVVSTRVDDDLLDGLDPSL